MTDPSATRSLFEAIDAGDAGAVARALDAGAEIEATDGEGRTPLVLAVIAAEPRVVELLLERGADPNRGTRGDYAPLALAAKMHMPLLLDVFGAGEGTSSGEEPAEPSIRLLAAHGANVAADAWVAASLAVTNQAVSTLAALDDAGVDWRAVPAGAEGDARQPLADLLLAQAIGHRFASLPVARFLVEHGADPHARPDGSPLLVQLLRQIEIETPVLTALLDAGAPVDAADGDGATALMYAAGLGHVEAFHSLLDRGADPLRQDARGRTAVHWAAGDNRQAILRAATERGLDRLPLPPERIDDHPGPLTPAANGTCVALSAWRGPGFLSVSCQAADEPGALALVAQRWGGSRSMVGPFPIVRVLDARQDRPMVTDPWALPGVFEVESGNLLVLEVAGVRIVEDLLRRRAPAGFKPVPLVAVVGRFPAAERAAAAARLAARTGHAVLVRFETAVMLEDGYETRLAGLRIGDRGLEAPGPRRD